MQEFLRVGRALAPAISTSFRTWLEAEIVESAESRNAYLNNFVQYKAGLQLALEDSDNIWGRKTIDHSNRLRVFTPQFTETVSAHTIARQLFVVKMMLSGLFRLECHIESHTQDQYEQLRKRPPGLPFLCTVQDALHEPWDRQRPKKPDSIPDAVQLVSKQTLALDSEHMAYASSIAGLSEKDNVEAIRKLQKDWLTIGCHYIELGANALGKIANVEFYQPKSITDQTSTMHPFVQVYTSGLRKFA